MVRSSENIDGVSLNGVREVALRLLARRAYSRAEMRRRLADRFPSDVVDAVLRRLVDVGLLNDVAYADAYVRRRFERGGLGRRRIEQELIERGVDPSVAGAAVSRRIDAGAERDRATRVLDRFFRLRRGNPEFHTAAACRHLLARGYPEILVRDLLEISL